MAFHRAHARRLLRDAAPAFFVATLLTACGTDGGESAAGPGTTFRTSGDTTFAVSTGVGDRSAWRAELVEELSIGAREGADEEMFGAISGVAARADGGVYVYDRQAHEIRRFDADGGFVTQVGREGEGPGEYGEVNNMLVLPDGRLVVNDPRLHRITWYDSAGAYQRSVPGLSGLFGGSGTGFSARADGDVVWVRAPVYVGTSFEVRRDGFLRQGADGTVDTLLAPDFELGAFSTNVVSPESRIRAQISTPFAPRGLWAVGHRGEAYGIRTDRYVLDVREPGGSVLRIRNDASPVPVGPEEGRAALDRTLANARTIDPSWRWTLPDVPPVKPFVKGLYLGDRGRIWLYVSTPGEAYEAENREGETETRWREPALFDVFEADGTYLGAVEPPPRTNLLAFRGDTVWAVYRDDLDVSHVKRFRVRFPDVAAGG